MSEDRIETIYSEAEALDHAVAAMEDNDLVFVLADEVPAVLEQVRRMSADHAAH